MSPITRLEIPSLSKVNIKMAIMKEVYDNVVGIENYMHKEKTWRMILHLKRLNVLNCIIFDSCYE